ncbi:MAG: hypothetical protein HY819_14490 [Acidobacteria bacterium]|nr:hypothetical protein [Acidobacteriota bacterium]
MNYFIRIIGFFVLLSTTFITGLAQDGGTISGKVTVNGKSIPGAQILVLQGSFDARNGRVAKVETDIEGQYKVTLPKAGDYFVIPLTSGFTFTSEPGSLKGGKAVTLSNGDDITGMDFSLQSGGVITGRILSFDNKPIGNTSIKLQRIESDGKKTPIYPINPVLVRTDDRGIYRIYGIPPGKYLVSVGIKPDASSPIFGVGRTYIPLTYFPSTTQEESAQIIEVKEGKENTNIDITAQRPEKSFRITGKVIDAITGKPIVGVGVVYGKYTGAEIGATSPSGLKTNARGEFQINGLTTGRYFVMGSNYFNVEAFKDFYSDKARFTISNDDVNNLEVKLHKATTISGTLVIDKLNNPTSAPNLSSLSLHAIDIKDTIGITESSTRPNGDGSFILRGLAPGEFRFGLFSGSQYPGICIINIETQNGVTNTLTVAGEEQINGVRILAAYGSATIRGEVKIDGTLPREAFMTVIGTREGQTANTASYNASVDARGRFTINNAVAGTYDLTLVYYPGNNKSPIKSKPRSVTINDGATIDVKLTLELNQDDQPKEGE